MKDVEMAVSNRKNGTVNSFGLAAVAGVVASDVDHQLFIFRKFDKLAARNLLNMQNELQYLERKQDELDAEAEFSADRILCSSLRNYDDWKMNLNSHEGLQRRQKLEEEIEAKLDKYYNALLRQSDLVRLDRPTPLALKTYREAVLGTGKDPAKVGGSAKTLLHDTRDLVALNDPVDVDLLSKLLRMYWPFRGAGIEHHDKARSFEERTLVYLVRLFSTAIAAVLLIGSILALYFVINQDARLALVIAFVTLFALSLSICTGATRDSIFAGTAAYAAVLIVFVSGNLSDRRGGRSSI